MDDVTARMNEFREAARHLWNTHLRAVAEPVQDWDVRDAFNEMAATLFRVLVLRPIGRDDWEFPPDHWADRKPFPFLQVVVDSATEILINREVQSGYWDFPIPVINPGELELQFLQYFDWWDLGHKDLAFYRVCISRSRSHPVLVGKHALVRVGEGIKVLAGAAEQADAADEVRVG